MQVHLKKQMTNTDGPIYGTTSQLGIIILSILQPSSANTHSTTNTTSYNFTQHVSPSSQALERKQVKYHDEGDQTRDQLELKIEKLRIIDNVKAIDILILVKKKHWTDNAQSLYLL